jgi:hypothetical protein
LLYGSTRRKVTGLGVVLSVMLFRQYGAIFRKGACEELLAVHMIANAVIQLLLGSFKDSSRTLTLAESITKLKVI